MNLDDDKKEIEIELDDMSDDDFMKMSPPFVNEETEEVVTEVEETVEKTEDISEEIIEDEDNKESEKKVEDTELKESEKVVNKEEEKETTKTEDDKTEDTENKYSESEEFMNKILKPFKADGKEVSVRNVDDAIRLMQMGSNYSRKMAELKPAKEAKAMLEANGLTTDTLNFLIDINKGDKDAIQKLLKDHKIDPLDFDSEKEIQYQSKDYTPDLDGMNFKEAISTTMEQEGGRKLINTIHSDWDDSSKELLKKDTSILRKVLDDQQDGVYDKVNAEREYQVRMGYLPADVPFYEGYQAVEQAMRRHGAFEQATNTNADNKSNSNGKTPIDTGPRKAKEEQPNPAPSSVANPQSKPNNGNSDNKLEDFFDMDDDAFNKLAPPKS